MANHQARFNTPDPDPGPGGVLPPANWDPNCKRGSKRHTDGQPSKPSKRPKLTNEESDFGDDNCQLEDDLTIRGAVEEGVDGGLRWIIVDMPAKENDPRADEVLQLLLVGAESTLDHPRCRAWVDGLRELSREMFWADESAAFERDAFRCLLMRCQRSLAVRGAIDLTVMVNLVQLVVKMDRCVTF